MARAATEAQQVGDHQRKHLAAAGAVHVLVVMIAFTVSSRNTLSVAIRAGIWEKSQRSARVATRPCMSQY